MLTGRFTSLGLFLPGLRANVATIRALVDAGRTVADAGGELSAVIDASNLSLDPTADPMSRRRGWHRPCGSSAAALDRSVATLAGYDRPYLLGALGTTVRDLRAQLAQASARTRTAADMAELAPSMLGGEGSRRYFVLFQDSAELRGGGGVTHVFAELTADHGSLRLARFGSVEDLNPAAAGRNPTPAEGVAAQYRQFDVANTWQNVNVSPDFAVTGRLVEHPVPPVGRT